MHRRKFVNNSFWITTGLLAGCGKSVEEKPITYQLLKGKVSSAAGGIANAVVSDGFNVVQTAADGSFEMNVPSNSKHAFVSVPSGYDFPHKNNIAHHYITLDGTSTQELNFELEPLKISDEKHQFVIWADPQLTNEYDLKKLTSKSIPDLLQYTSSLASGTLIHGIMMGDIVFDNTALFPAYNNAMEKCGIPFYQIIGNHDMAFYKGSKNYDADFSQMYGPLYYSFNRGQVHYIVLNDVFYIGGEVKYKAFIENAQLVWLKKDLSFVSPDKLIILCLHIPATWLDNRHELYDMLRGHKVHIMSGHSHYNQNYISDDIFEHVHGAVCGAWWTGPVCTDGTPPGYAVYEVNGTDMEWHYKSVGYKENYQIRTNVKKENEVVEFQANIWNWDPEWKVEWWADGDLQGDMPKQDDFDYLADKLYRGPQLPAGKLWVEPYLTDHIFKVVLPVDTKKVKVVATDRFGRKYESIANV